MTEDIDVRPRNLTWNLKISPWKRKVHLETIILRFHVKFRGCSFTVEFDQVIKLFFCCQQNSCCFSPVFKIASCENFHHLLVLLCRHLLCLQHFFLKPHCPRFCTSSASNVLRTMRIEVVKSVPKCGKCISNATFMKGYVDVWGWLECSSGIFYP